MPKKRNERGVLRKDGQPRESNMGTANPVVDDTNWRVKVVRRNRIKFDDEAKQRYLDALKKTGRRWAAEEAAGVARQTVATHLKNDPDFAQACEEAAEEYATAGLISIEKDALEGQLETSYDPEGNVVREVRRFETKLREMFLKRYDKEYNDKYQVEHSGEIGGVTLIPGLAALSDWMGAVEAHDRASAQAQNPDAAESEAAGSQQ